MGQDEVIEHQEDLQQEAVMPEPQEESGEAEQPTEDSEGQEESQEEKMVPLSALQKERKKRQEAELHADWQLQERQKLMQMQQPQKEVEEDETLYEAATRADLNKTKQETAQQTAREIKEQIWIESNPDKKQFIDENLEKFLKQRPGYARALEVSPNRYKEAYDLMTAFTPKQPKKVKKEEPRKEAPNAPSSVPKSSAMNANVDIMSMNDAEFREWRKSKIKRR